MAHLKTHSGEELKIKFHDTKETLLKSIMYCQGENQTTFNVVLESTMTQKIRVIEVRREDETGKNFNFKGILVQSVTDKGDYTNVHHRIDGFVSFP